MAHRALDEEIRRLEFKDTPMSDESMRELKHERAEMKDTLYESLVVAQK